MSKRSFMRLLVILLVNLALLPSTTSLASTTSTPQRASFIRKTLPVLLAPLLLAPPAALAVPYELRFQGTYDDLLHPSCVREIIVKPSTNIDAKGRKVKGYFATFRGTDVGPPGIGDKVIIACDEDSIKKYGLREFEFTGKVEGTR